MRFLRLSLLAIALAFPALAQNKFVSVPTVTDMLAQSPETLANSPSFGATNFIAYVETSGDTVPGTAKKTWWWSATSTLATNTAAANGPLAWPNGAAAGRWLYVPEAGFVSSGVSLASAGVPGQLPSWWTTNSIGSSGVTTNAFRCIARVVLTATDLVSVNPQSYLAENQGTIVYWTTTGDFVAGAGQRHWLWDATSTAATNFANAGGPLAWPYGSVAGRWIECKPYTATDARILVMTGLYPDAADGTVNTNDPSVYFNSVYSAASSAYDPILGKVTVDHPNGLFTCNELIWRGKIRYKSQGEFHVRKRSEPVGTVNRSIVTTQRLGFINQDPVDGSFLSWGTSGSTNFAIADNWYGLSDDMEVEGPGKFIFDQANKSLNQPALRLLEVRNFWSAPGSIEVWLAASTNGGNNSYGIQPCGRGIVMNYPIVRGGLLTTQDGIHVGWGSDIYINGGYADSGDDAVACQAEAAGGFTSPPDEPLRHVRITNVNVHSKRARAAVIHNGLNQINVPYTNRVPAYQDIVVDGLFGTCAEVRQSGWQIGNWPDSTSVQNYSIVTGGSGYSNGYWGLPVTATAGGSGAYCIVKVETNTITRAYPAKAGTGTGWVTVGTNAVGSTNILIGSGSGYIFPGDKIKFTGDGTTYTVNSVSNNAAMTLTAGTSVGLASGVAITIQTSSTSAWKTGTGYRQDEAPVITGFIPGGSGASITANVFGTPNNLIVDCGIQNYNLEIGSTTHDGTEPYAFRVHGGTRIWTRNGRITITENATNAAHRPFWISGVDGFDCQNVRVSPTTSGGYIRVDDGPKGWVDGVVFDNFEMGPHNKSGHGLIKITGIAGSVVVKNSKLHVGSGQTAAYFPDYESTRTCYSGWLEFSNNRFDGTTNGSNKAIDFVPNAGGTGLVCGMFKFVGNVMTNINSFDTAAVIQTACSAYEIRDNTGGMRTKLQIQVTQNSGATTVSIPISTYTGLIDATIASLPQITGITPVDYLGNWRIRANSTTAATLETATAPSSNVVWNVTIDTSRKPLTGY
ncbi:MAG: hypothetical protein U1G08_21100 [Verrucomicrobiota bacterium]